MRRRLNCYDYVLWSTAFVLLPVAVPNLFVWFQLTGKRQFFNAISFVLGAMAFWLACFRPRLLQDKPTEHIDLWDCIMAASGLFFGAASFALFLRSFQSGVTPNNIARGPLLGLLSLFAFYCIIDRGGLRKFALICALVGSFFLSDAAWKLGTGSVSPRQFYISEPSRARGYVSMAAAVLLLGCALVAYVVQKRRDKRC